MIWKVIRKGASLAVAGLVGGLIFWSSDYVAADEPLDTYGSQMANEFAGDSDGIEYGRERFSARCAFCHGGAGKGGKGPALTKGHFKRGGRNEDLFFNIAGGIPNTQMGAFGGTLDGDEIWKIIAYIRDVTNHRRAAGEIE